MQLIDKTSFQYLGSVDVSRTLLKFFSFCLPTIAAQPVMWPAPFYFYFYKFLS